MCRTLNKDFLISKLFLKLTLHLSALCAALVASMLSGCDCSTQNASLVLLKRRQPKYIPKPQREASEETGQAVEEGGEDDAVSKN